MKPYFKNLKVGDRIKSSKGVVYFGIVQIIRDKEVVIKWTLKGKYYSVAAHGPFRWDEFVDDDPITFVYNGLQRAIKKAKGL